MARMVNFAAGMGILAVLLTSACATSGAGSAEEAARNRAHLAEISLLPTCTAAATATGDRPEQIPDCRLKASPAGLNLVVASDPLEHELLGLTGFVSVAVADRSGRHVSDFAEVTHGRYAYPELRDVNADRLQDLVIPVTTSEAETIHALWMQQENGDFTHAGQIRGEQIAWNADGLIAAASQASVSEWTVSYFRIEDGKIREVAQVTGQGSRPPRLGERCEIVRISEGFAPRRFCASR